MKIALLGFGVVGKGVFDICQKQKDLEIVGVFCREADSVPNGLGVTDGKALCLRDDVDTVVEVLGGLHPSYELVSLALKNRKNVVSANKHLICTYQTELTGLAEENGVALRATAAVGGGIPWLTSLARAKRTDSVFAVDGIMNGTTNFILDSMKTGDLPFASALAEAQRLGYAEADPSADIDGLDVCRKLAISLGVAFDVAVSAEDIPTFGIRQITDRDIAAFRGEGYICKLLADGGLNADGSIYAAVEPVLLPSDMPEANVPKNYNMISVYAENAGKTSFIGQGAGRYPTANNVVSDLCDILAGERAYYTKIRRMAKPDHTQRKTKYYLRAGKADPWIADHTERKCGDGVLTCEISAAEMYEQAKRLAGCGADFFFARIKN